MMCRSGWMGAIATGMGALAMLTGTAGCQTRTVYTTYAPDGGLPSEEGRAPDERTGDGDGESPGDPKPPQACVYPAAQGPTEPCCPELGIDACGAKLACAALEGRTVAVCYMERSVDDDEPCTMDRLCRSESCTNGRCAYSSNCPGPSAACAPTATGKPRLCTPETPTSPAHECTEIGANNYLCRACAKTSDCPPPQNQNKALKGCTNNSCRYKWINAPPDAPEDCE